jgi:hypothetical protein
MLYSRADTQYIQFLEAAGHIGYRQVDYVIIHYICTMTRNMVIYLFCILDGDERAQGAAVIHVRNALHIFHLQQ